MDIAGRKSRREKASGDRVGGRSGAASLVGGVDIDQLTKDFPGLALVRGQRRLCADHGFRLTKEGECDE